MTVRERCEEILQGKPLIKLPVSGGVEAVLPAAEPTAEAGVTPVTPAPVEAIPEEEEPEAEDAPVEIAEEEDGSKSVRVGKLRFRSTDTALDLSTLRASQLEEVFPVLEEMAQLESVKLSPSLGFAAVGRVQQLPSQPLVDYRFSLYGKEFSTADTSMNLNAVPIGDNGEALRAVLPYMTNCSMVEMERCGLRYVTYAAIRDEFPERGIVWRVDFGGYSVRTDETRILASIKGYNLTGEKCAVLKYCTKVRYLDLGHNIIDDISFVEYMPDLEVAILAINYWSDASPLAACKKLEYLEIFNTRCTDLSPLSELTNLKHLNVCWIKELRDISPLYNLTGLERLWIGCVNQVPKEQLEEIRERLPDTNINTTTDNPTSEGWRKDPRYDLLSEQFGYHWLQPYSTPSGPVK